MRNQPITKLDFQAPIKTVSEANVREHWAVKNRRKQSQQMEMLVALQNNLRGRKVQLPCVVKLTRIGPQKLDGDNLQRSCKGIRDQIAKQLNVDDGDEENVTWQYHQMPMGYNGDYAVKVEITS